MKPEPGSLAELLQYVPSELHSTITKYVDDVSSNPEARSDTDRSFIGFTCDYIQYAQLLERKLSTHGLAPFRSNPEPVKPLTVYDVGCGSLALQHLLFDPRIHYVGIDLDFEPTFFRPNCRFVRGRFRDVVDSLDIDPETAIGIANMSLFYFTADLPVFDRVFRRKFVL